MEDFNESEIVFDESEVVLSDTAEKASFNESEIVFDESEVIIDEQGPTTEERAQKAQSIRDQHRADVRALAEKQGLKQKEDSVVIKDLGAATMSGAADFYGKIGYGIEAAGNSIGAESLSNYGKAVQKTGDEAEAFWDSAKSKAAKDAELKKFIVNRPDGRTDYENTIVNIVSNPGKIGLSVAESLAATGAGMATGGFLAKAFSLIPKIGQGIAGAMGYGLGEGTISAIGGAQEVEEKIDKMPFEKLALHPEFRAALIETDGNKQEAKDIVKKAAAGDAAAFNLLTTTILSSPMGYAFSPIFANKGNISTNFIDSFAIGVLGEGAQEGLQSGAEKAGQNLAVQNRADQEQKISEGVDEASLGGVLTGAAMGGGTATAAEIYVQYDAKKQTKIRQKAMFDYAMGFEWTSLTPEQQRLKESLKEFNFTSLTPEQQQKKEELKSMFFSSLSPEQQEVIAKENARVEEVQGKFKQLVLGNPNAEIPTYILDDIDMQERLIKELDDAEAVLGRKEQTYIDMALNEQKQTKEEQKALEEIDAYFKEQKLPAENKRKKAAQERANEKRNQLDILYNGDEDLINEQLKVKKKRTAKTEKQTFGGMSEEDIEEYNRQHEDTLTQNTEIELSNETTTETPAKTALSKDEEYELSKLQEREDEGEELDFDEQDRLETLRGKALENEIVLDEPATTKENIANDKLPIPQEAAKNEEQPKSTPSEVETGDKIIGKNADVETLYEDENGAVIPTNQERFNNGRSIYLTKEEFEELSGTKKDDIIIQEDTKGAKDERSTEQRGNTGGTDIDAASGKPGIPNQEQTISKQEITTRRPETVSEDNKRPTRDTDDRSEKAELASEAAFIKEEYTKDGDYVDYEKIKEAFTEKQITEEENKKSDMRPAFVDIGAILKSPFAITKMLNDAKNKLDKIISDSITGKIKDTRIDDFIRRRLGGSQAGLGLLTRKQEGDFVKKYRTLQAKLAQADMSAEEKAKIIEESQGSIATDIFNMVSIQYLENPESRELIAEEYPELVDALNEVREYINSLSREAMERGLILPSQHAKWEDRYLSRLYILTQKPQVAAKVTSGIKLYEQKSGRKIDSIIDYLIENPTEANRLGAVLDIDKIIKATIAKTQGNIGLEEFLRSITESTDIVNSDQVIKLEERIANLPIVFSPEYAKQVVIPYIEDMIYNLDKTTHLTADMYYIAITEAKIEKLTKAIEYIKESIEYANANTELYDNDTMAQLPKDKRYGPLSGLYLPIDVASLVISQFAVVHNPKTLVDKIDHAGKKLLVYFKWAKVPANIFSYPRNAISNFFQWTMSGADPVNFLPLYTEAIFSMIKKDKWYQNARKGGMLQTNVISAEINDALKIMIEGLGKEKKITRATYKAMEKVGDMYGLIDDLAKIARMRYAMEQDGLSLEEAVNIAQEAHYDYSLTYDLVRAMRDPDFSRGMGLKIIGTLFPTYTHKTIAFLYDTIINRPATLALLGASIFMLVGGDDDDRDEIGHERYDKIMEDLPKWVKDNPFSRIDVKMVNGQAEITITDIGYVVPPATLISALAQTLSGDPVGGMSKLGLGGAPVHMIGGIITNRDPFTKKEIYYEHDETQKYLDIASYVGLQMAPGTVTKLYSLNETRHPVVPRLVGINSYVYDEKELASWKFYGAKKAKLDASKRILFYKRKITHAQKMLSQGEISEEDFEKIREKNVEKIMYWKKLGNEAYKTKIKE